MGHISPQIWLVYIQQVKNKLKSDPTILEICKKYGMDPEDLDLVPIQFGDIDVSAKTDRGVITFNWNLLKKENKDQLPAYFVHEFNHYASQSRQPTQSADEGDYLSNPDEQNAFQYQIKYIDDHFGKDEAEKYVDQVLDHHDATGKERKQKENILMKKVD